MKILNTKWAKAISIECINNLVKNEYFGEFIGLASKVLFGSCFSGFYDHNSDIDILFYLKDSDYIEIYQLFKKFGIIKNNERLYFKMSNVNNNFFPVPVIDWRVLSTSDINQEFEIDLPATLWEYLNSVILEDPDENFVNLITYWKKEFEKRRYSLIYSHFSDLSRIRRWILYSTTTSKRESSLIFLISRFMRLFLQINCLIDSKVYPRDKWLFLWTKDNINLGKENLSLINNILSFKKLENCSNACNKLYFFIKERIINNNIYTENLLNYPERYYKNSYKK